MKDNFFYCPKITPTNKKYQMSEAIPYPGAKPMYLVEDLDDKIKLTEMIKSTIEEL